MCDFCTWLDWSAACLILQGPLAGLSAGIAGGGAAPLDDKCGLEVVMQPWYRNPNRVYKLRADDQVRNVPLFMGLRVSCSAVYCRLCVRWVALSRLWGIIGCNLNNIE
jgi:hypothetical protein